jgi:AbrB family looped-hinge helix DNA binding protein
MRINSKGQITIPKVIRERAGLLPGTEVDFLCEGDVVKIVPRTHKPKISGAQVVEHLRGRGSLKYTTDQIMKMTRG